ncbi:unnamed protein product [Urochloa humidicola]
MENSAIASVNRNRDIVDGSFDQRFATPWSIAEDCVTNREHNSPLKKKPAPICYGWCDPSLWMHISRMTPPHPWNGNTKPACCRMARPIDWCFSHCIDSMDLCIYIAGYWVEI